MRPLALDMFCGAGGASMGLHRAGFDVVGVDIRPQPHYPFPFMRADALRPPVDLRTFDFVWASPPCQAHTPLRHVTGRSYADVIPETRAQLRASGVPYCIENVPGAPLFGTVMLCGTMFGLGVRDAELRRHRWFETNFLLLQPECRHGGGACIGVYGKSPENRGAGSARYRTITVTGSTPQQNVERNRVRETYSVADAREAMGIDWMPMSGLAQAVPPAYAEFIGRAAMQAVSGRAA
jgi:DNA (cytosine-5)-methyltransferase 1